MKKSDVIKHFGTQADVANAMTAAGYKITQPAVSKWPQEIPPLRAYQIERLTNGVLRVDDSSESQHEPDLFSNLVA